jgi:deoxyribonuclease-4
LSGAAGGRTVSIERPLLGSHMSIAGGVHTAFERARRAGCTAMQVFTKNNTQWSARPYTPDDISRYAAARSETIPMPVVAHASYLINLCAVSAATIEKSLAAFADELRRCEALQILGLVVHPGAHMQAGEAAGIRKIAESFNAAHRLTPGFRTLSLLETTAGQGTSVGYRFEHLRDIIALVDDQSRMGVCLDTCHIFAAGYDISTPEGWESTFRQFDAVIGLNRLAAIHVNDSKKPLASRVDRHDHIGKGVMGLTPFRMLMNDERLAAVPKILETEKSDDLHEDIENMSLLRSLIAPVR